MEIKGFCPTTTISTKICTLKTWERRETTDIYRLDACRVKHKLTLKVFSLICTKKKKETCPVNSFFCMERTLQPVTAAALYER